MKTAKKPAPKKRAAAKPIKPKKGPGSGKPNFHARAKAHGADLSAKPKDPETVPPVIMEIDPDVVAAMSHGRPTKLTPDLGSRICTLYARGEHMEEIASHEGMPDWSTIYAWLAAPSTGVNGKLYDAFRQTFTRARELRAHTRLGKIEEYIRRTTSTKAQRDAGLDALDPTAARVGMEGQRILMELENRGAYGKQLTLKGDKDNPLELRTAKQLTREELMAIANGGLEGAE
jgi:hypothetical protein